MWWTARSCRSPTIQWVGTAKCKHGKTTSTTYHTGPMVSLDPTQMVVTAYRQHQLIVGCDCPTAAPKLNATVTYAASNGVQPGERRIIVEQSASIKPPAKNFVYYGRLVCARGGAYYIDATITLGQKRARTRPGVRGRRAGHAERADERRRRRT